MEAFDPLELTGRALVAALETDATLGGIVRLAVVDGSDPAASPHRA